MTLKHISELFLLFIAICRYIEIFRSTAAEVRRVRLNNLMRMERDIPSLFDRGGPRGGSGRNSRNVRGKILNRTGNL